MSIDGGFASHVLVPDARYLLEYDPLPVNQAATLMCSGVTAYGALKRLVDRPRQQPEACERRALEQVAAAAFGQRRKMLRQSLKSLGLDPIRLSAAAHVEATRRAETIPVSGFVAMARELADIRAAKQS